MNGPAPQKCALWARVSSSDGSQTNENQLHELREWAARRGLEVAREFVTEDSAWANGNGRKGSEFDTRRAELLDGARLGHYQVVLCWGLDRLSRRGAEDMLAFVRRLTETGCALWSSKDPWCESLVDPMLRELLLSIFATIARFESERRSERIKAGMARRRRDLEAGREVKGEQRVGGRKPGSKDKRKRSRDGYKDAWAPGGKLRVAREQRLAEKRAAEVEQVSAIVSEAAESAAQENSTGSEEQ